MTDIYLGIDVGGTHTDGVAVADDGRILCKAKVKTTTDIGRCSLDALEMLLDYCYVKGVTPSMVSRVVLSTTLITNAAAMGRFEPTGLLLFAGPGLNPDHLLPPENGILLTGTMDHRGREVISANPGEIRAALERFTLKGIQVVAVSSKFGVRNPAHELLVREMAGNRFDHLVMAHTLSGSLNFPRRTATAYLAAGVWRLHDSFVESMQKAVRSHEIDAPLYLLRGDGGTQLASTLANPAETALCGPAASIMGGEALDPMEGETLLVDVGGTTSDLSLFRDGVPLLEPSGAVIGRFKTQIRALFNRSFPIGGDSSVAIHEGELTIGPSRLGPPVCQGGPAPTPTDAMVALELTPGNVGKARDAMNPIAWELGVDVDGCCRAILKKTAEIIAGKAKEFMETVNSKHLYTVHEIIENVKIDPDRCVVVGGPAEPLAPFISEALNMPVTVPPDNEVANAIGAALATVNLELNIAADTPRGKLSIPEAGIHRDIPRNFSLEEAIAEGERLLLKLAADRGLRDVGAGADIVEQETFKVVEGHTTAGSIHRLRLQLRPGILCRAIPSEPKEASDV